MSLRAHDDNARSETTKSALLAALNEIEKPTEAMLKEAGRVCVIDPEHLHGVYFIDERGATLIWRAMIRAKRAELESAGG